MRANRFQLLLAGGILLFSALESIRAFPSLPDPMASNFGGDGAAGGWSSKAAFMSIYAVSMTFWAGTLLAAPYVAARARQGFDERARRWLRDHIGWFVVASLGLSSTVSHWVIEANLVTGRLSSSFAWLFGVYMAYMLWWTLSLVRRATAGKSKSPTPR